MDQQQIESQLQMNFSYQSYVERFTYKPFQWPPDIGLAELHSRVSQPGPQHPDSVECPCCQIKSKRKIIQWWKNDVNEACKEFGTAVPAYFGLLKYYGVAILVVMLVNSIYTIMATYKACEYYDPNSYCVHSGVLFYLDFARLVQLLDNAGEFDLSHTLVILQAVTFYFLLFVNLGSLVYLAYMQRREQQTVSAKGTLPSSMFNGDETKIPREFFKKAPRNALIVHNASTISYEQLVRDLKVKNQIQIASVIELREIKRYYQAFQQRNLLYYGLLAKFVQCEDPFAQTKVNGRLKAAYERCQIERAKLFQASGSVIVFFKTEEMASQVAEFYQLSAFRKTIFGGRQLLREWGIAKEILELPLSVVYLPPVQQMKWESIGQHQRAKLAGRIKTAIIAVGLILICYFLLAEPIKLVLNEQTSNANLTPIQKILPILISFGLVGLSLLYRQYMDHVSKRRNPLTDFEHSKFVLMTSVLFHIVFYLIIPTLFFTVDNGIDYTLKLYVISEQARTFIFMQMVLSAIDVPFRNWQRKKVRNLSDQRHAFRYCQSQLHQTVQYRDYPLQIRLQTMYRIWSFALFYTFFVPYMIMYMLIAILVLFWLEKRNFYKHYSLRRTISLKLQSEFLAYYINFFCIFQFFTYSLNNYGHPWFLFPALIATVLAIVFNIVYWLCFYPHHKEKQGKEGKEGKEPLISPLSQEAEVIYKRAYESFLASIQNDKLDLQIRDYLKQAKLPEKAEKQQIIIELMDSEVEIESDSD